MTNPTNKRTHESFLQEIPTHLDIQITGIYTNTDTKIEYKCKHGLHYALPWQILKFKHCCRKGYYESGKMWASTVVQPDKRLEFYKEKRPLLDFSDVVLLEGSRNKFSGIKCTLHKEVTFTGTSTKQHCTPCPICKEENFKALMKLRVGVFHATHKITPISKAEKRWLDDINVPERQYWVKEAGYRVDGYDPSTNTVYLYHGRFWHGCPETYDPESIHPVLKEKMKDVYARTKLYEQKIIDAGYALVVKWG